MSEDETTPTPTYREKRTFNEYILKKERVWRRVQDTSDMIKTLPKNSEIFRARAVKTEDDRKEFFDILSTIEQSSAAYPEFQTDTASISSAFDSMYFAIISRRDQFPLPVAPNASTSGSTTAPTALASCPTPMPRSSYLPQLNIKPFGGDMEQFPGFISLYNALIHNNVSLSDIEKFSFLLSYLSGRPLKLAQTVPFAPNNYTTAYQLISNEFSNPRVVASHYLSKLFSLQPINAGNPGLLKELTDTLQANVSCLEKLAVPNLDQYILLHWSLRLLDNKTRSEFETKFLNTTFPAYSDFIKFLREKCT